MMTTLPEFAAVPRRGNSERIGRALLVAVGPAGCAVAESCLSLSQRWLYAEPPLEILPFATDPDQHHSMAARRCQAAAERIRALTERGFTLDRHGEIALWLLVDVAGWEATAAGDGEVDTPRPVSLEAVLAYVDRLAETAWTQLRVRTLVHALLLVAPQHQPQALDLLHHLNAACGDRVYLAGPVDHRHLRLEEDTWQQHAATGLAALLWGQAPSHSAFHQANAGPTWTRALGAAAWTTPRSEIAHWLASTWALRTVETLADSAPGVEVAAPHHLLPASPQRLLEELESSLSRPFFPPASVHPHPDLLMLHDLPACIEDRLLRLEARAQPERRQARNRWLAHHLATREVGLDGLRSHALAPADSWPRLHDYRRQLQTLQQSLQARLHEVEETLIAYSEQIEQAERTYHREQTRLERQCRSIPATKPLGLLRIAAQPWRWPGWLWTYLRLLPRQMQALAEAHHRHIQLVWEQANWHCVRQLHLAMAQQVQERLAATAALQDLLAEMSADLAQQIRAVETGIPDPWSRGRLAWLYDHLLGDGSAAAWSFLAAAPFLTWTDASAAERVEQLQIWGKQRLETLAGWHACDFLAAALPEDALSAWMEHFVAAARPLWPAQELSGDLPAETWLYEPHDVQPAPETGSEAAATDEPSADGTEPPSTAATGGRQRLRAWRDQQPDLFVVHSAVDGLLVLRWLPVDLKMV